MKIIQCYCDCCGKRVIDEDDLEKMTIHSSFKVMQDNSYPYDNVEICKDCVEKIDKIIEDTFKKIKYKK